MQQKIFGPKNSVHLFLIIFCIAFLLKIFDTWQANLSILFLISNNVLLKTEIIHNFNKCSPSEGEWYKIFQLKIQAWHLLTIGWIYGKLILANFTALSSVPVFQLCPALCNVSSSTVVFYPVQVPQILEWFSVPCITVVQYLYVKTF